MKTRYFLIQSIDNSRIQGEQTHRANKSSLNSCAIPLCPAIRFRASQPIRSRTATFVGRGGSWEMSLETEVHRLNVVHRRPAKQPRLAPTLWPFPLPPAFPPNHNFAANLSVQDLWYIGNTRWPQFTAHYAAFPTCFLSPREFPFFSFLDTLSNVPWIGFSLSAHSSRTLFDSSSWPNSNSSFHSVPDF